MPNLNIMLKIFQFFVIKLFEPIFFNRHPNRLELWFINFFSFVLRFSQPSDRWNLPIFVNEWTKILDQNVKKNKESKSIFMFTCYQGQFTHDIFLSIFLAMQGHRIVLGYLPKLRSPIKEPLEDSKNVGIYITYVMKLLEKKSKGKIKCFNLASSDIISCKSNISYRKQAFSDTVMMLQKEEINFQNERDLFSFNFCMERLRKSDTYFKNFFKNNSSKIDLCLIANGASFENSQLLKNAKSFKLDFNTYEKFAFKNARIISHNGPFHEFEDLFFLKKFLMSIFSNNEKNNIVDKSNKLMEERKKSLGDFWGLKYQKEFKNINRYEKNIYKLIQNNEFVLICPNVPFDAGYESINSIFSSMKVWLIETIEYILKHSNKIVVVRAHPAEERQNFGNEKCEFILKRFKHINRLYIIPGKSKLNTYSLIEKCLFNIVYSSSTGVEAVMLGKNVITGASCYHGKIGITKSFDNKKNYFSYLKKVLGKTPALNGKIIFEAHLIYYLLHFVIQLPYPYDKPSNYIIFPPKKLVLNKLFLQYENTINVLTMNNYEYKKFCKTNYQRILNVWHEKRT